MKRIARIGLVVTETQDTGVDTILRVHYDVIDATTEHWILRSSTGRLTFVTDAELRMQYRAVVINRVKMRGSKYHMGERHHLAEIV